MKIVRKTITLLVILFGSLLFADNEFIIESFKALPNDMAGSVYAKKDGNNEFCGLIKVKTGIREELAFDSGLKFSPSEKKNPGEYWVYVSPGEGRLTLMAEGFVPKHFQISTVKIESKRTYEMVVRAKEEEKIPVVILTDPPDAEKLLDGTSQGTGDNFQITPGDYLLTVRKHAHKDYTRQVRIDKDNTLFKDIKLEEIEIQGVNIRSVPSGATVYIDNIEKGKTDLPDWLYPGEYTLKLSLSGYLDVTEKILVQEGKTNNFSYTLQKNAGYVNLSVTPSDADIRINGQSYQSGKTELIPGKYRISISKSGYLSQEKEITVELGETITLSYTLVENIGTLSLQITPSDAKLQINKREYSHRSPIKLSPGTYKVEISKDGWYAQDEILTLKLGETLSKDYTLQKKTGTLQFSVQPLDGKVELRDATGKLYKSWTGMRLEKDIPAGEYELSCTCPGYLTKKQIINIQDKRNEVVNIQLAPDGLTETAKKKEIKTPKLQYRVSPLSLFISAGFAEPGLLGTSALAYYHNPQGHGFDVKLGARKPLADFFEMPSYLPITAQVALGYQHNAAKIAWSEALNAITLNIDALYNLNEVVEIPYVGVNPFLGIKYDAQMYSSTLESYTAHLLGLQLGVMACYDLSDLVTPGLGVELVLGQTFDFDVSGTYVNERGNVATGIIYINLNISYVLNKNYKKG